MNKTYTHTEFFPQIEHFLAQNQYGVLEILGPTASGKTGYSISLAKQLERKHGYKFEIISVDSRQIFHEFNIGAAKVTHEEMQGVPHHGLDLIYPHETYSAYDFQQYAFEKIEEIHNRGNRVILAGGTMLWLDAISENYKFKEKGQKSDEKGTPLYPFLKVGIHWDRKVLYERINERAKLQFANGMIEETRDLLDRYEISKSAFTSFGYQEVKHYLDLEWSLEKAIEANQKRNRNYAKRQLIWWRGRDDVFWVEGSSLQNSP